MELVRANPYATTAWAIVARLDFGRRPTWELAHLQAVLQPRLYLPQLQPHQAAWVPERQSTLKRGGFLRENRKAQAEDLGFILFNSREY